MERTCGGDHSLLERKEKNQCKTQFCIHFSCIKKKWKSMFGHSSKATPFIKYESICYHKVVLKAICTEHRGVRDININQENALS